METINFSVMVAKRKQKASFVSKGEEIRQTFPFNSRLDLTQFYMLFKASHVT